MGFTKPYLPDLDPDAFLKKPLMERVRILGADWAENGFGAPRMVHTIYIVKLVVFFAIGGITVATVTSGLPAFWHVSQWWNQPIVYQKVILWTVLLEAIGVAGSWGPLAGKVIRVSPPLTMALEEARDYLDALYGIFAQVGNDLRN